MTVCRQVVEGLVCGLHWSHLLQPVVALPGSQALGGTGANGLPQCSATRQWGWLAFSALRLSGRAEIFAPDSLVWFTLALRLFYVTLGIKYKYVQIKACSDCQCGIKFYFP